MDIAAIKAQHKLLKEWTYNWTPLNKGYTDKILYINVGTTEIKERDVPPVMKEKFIGGKGGNRKKYGRIFILIYIAP